MKYYDTKFEDYLKSYFKSSLHPKNKDLYKNLPKDVKDLENLIFYGPEGTGKYTQSLASICRYSPTKLNYEKKICVTFNKQPHYIKISDIHYEIDMSLLGCNTKMLWNEIYNNILDIVLSKPNGIGIILCKNFQSISNELLDSFYSYMQTNFTLPIKIIFVLITSQISFIPDNILERCKIVNIARPSLTQYKKIINSKLDPSIKLEDINNIKDLYAGVTELMFPHHKICDILIDDIININDKKFLDIREHIYNVFIYNIDIGTSISYIIQKLIHKKLIGKNRVSNLFFKTTSFLQFYNNNYRPIYHLESYILYLSSLVNGY
jgi:hypothetical protein